MKMVGPMFEGNSWKLFVVVAILLVAGGFLLLSGPQAQKTQASGLASMPELEKIPVSPQEKTKVSFGYTPISYYLPAFVAKEKGFFAEEGLDVEMVKFETVNNAMEALVNDNIQLSMAGYPTLFALQAASPGEFKMFGHAFETMERNQHAILVPVNSKVKSIEELKGKKIGTYTGSTQKLYINLIMKKLGFEEGKGYEIVQVATSLQVQAFAAGQFDALLTIEPYVTISLEKGVGRVLVQNPRGKYVLDPLPAGPAGAVSAKLLQRDPATAQKIVRAIEKAVEYINANETDARKVLTKYVPIAEQAALKIGLYNWKVRPTAVDMQSVQQMADLFHENGELKTGIDAGTLWLPQG